MDEQRRWTSITIRFKTPLVDALREVAEAENRSFNGAVLEAVEQYLKASQRPSGGITSMPASAATVPRP